MTIRTMLLSLTALGAIGAGPVPGAAVEGAAGYRLAMTVPLGSPDRWDYVLADGDTRRVYVAHGDRVTVVDAATGTIVGEVTGMPGGTHGVAISAATGRGFTDDGAKAQAVAFDLKTLKVLDRTAVGEDADAVVRDPATGRILVVDGDPGTISVLAPDGRSTVATIGTGEKLEYLAANRHGQVYVAGEAKSDLVRVDARTAQITARWPTPDCKSPHGLALDDIAGRVFIGCVNAKMMVVDAANGRVVAQLPIGLGNDAVAWDAARKRVFSSNGRDGTISVYRQLSPDRYEALPTIRTAVSGRTMAVDGRTGRLFVVAADTEPSTTPGGRPRIRPGTTRLMIFDPVA